MTAKDALLARVAAFSEAEADDALRLLDMRTDPVLAAFLDAPEDEKAAEEGRADIAAERVVTLDESMRDFG